MLMRHSVTCSVPQGIGKNLSDLLLFGNCKMIEIVTWNGLREEALETGVVFFFSPNKMSVTRQNRGTQQDDL